MITVLVAYDQNRLIGNGPNLPWYLPEDLKLFKARTWGHAIIMGRTTYDHLPKKPLPGRTNIVLTSREIVIPDTAEFGASVLPAVSPQDALKLAAVQLPNKEIFVIGGAKVYESFLSENLVDRVLVSEIPGDHAGNIYFPELKGEWDCKTIENFDRFAVKEYLKRK